jgi:hypothetical protein
VRTDQALIEHEKNGDELLLFIRRTKTEYEAGGFRYEGRFRYMSHTGTRPGALPFSAHPGLSPYGKMPSEYPYSSAFPGMELEFRSRATRAEARLLKDVLFHGHKWPFFHHFFTFFTLKREEQV